MSECRACGRNVRWADTPDGKRVSLEPTPASRGPNRFREIGYNPLRVEAIPDDADALAYERHDCERAR